MHIVVSKLVAEKYNLSDKFIAGSVIPDIYAKCNIARDITHYIDPSKSNLPNYEEFMKINREKLKDELILGYTLIL